MLNGLQRNKKIPGCNHFWWSEVVPLGREQPTTSLHFSRIVALGGYLESVRSELGNKPIYITSWFRGVYDNARVGGASKSRHLFGDAVDFYCQHLTSLQIYQKLDKWHGTKGGLGLYSSHVHLDLRGYLARWGT